MSTDVGTFTIHQLEGEKKRLELFGRALPYKSFILEGNQRAEMTWYPGSATASVQMLGATEKTTSVNGVWNNKFLQLLDADGEVSFNNSTAGKVELDGHQIEDVQRIAIAVDQFRLEGMLVEVQWNDKLRHGFITRFKQTWKTNDELDWEIEFTWSSRGEPRQYVADTSESPWTISEIIKLVQELVSAAQDEIDAVSAEIDKQYIAPITKNLGLIEDTVSAVEDITTSATQLIVTPFEAAQRTLAALVSIKDTAQDITDHISSTPQRLMFTNPTSQDLDFGTDLEADSFSRSLYANARAIALGVSAQADILKDQTQPPNVLATFVAREDMDLRSVSVAYYGTPDQWRQLRDYNGFDSSRLSAGDLVIVPQITGRERSA